MCTWPDTGKKEGTGGRSGGEGAHSEPDSKHLVYDILPSNTAVFSYAIGSRKLSANEQFFVGAQTIVSLLQTTQIKQGVSFITANKVPESGAQSVTPTIAFRHQRRMS